MSKNKNKYKELYLPQILSLLKKELKDLWIKWVEEQNTVDAIQFELTYKWRYIQSAINVYQPYEISYRLIWWRNYKKCMPYKFVDEIKDLLIH